MNNFIKYFYNINIEKVIYNDKYYSFFYNGYIYKLYVYDGDIKNLKTLYDINKSLICSTLMSEIILNKNNDIVSEYNGIFYILIKIYVNMNKNINLNEISIFSKFFLREKHYINWGILWSNKIDYLESLISENGKKYPLMVDSFNYFVAMAENAISYFNSIKFNNDYECVISHKVIKYEDSVEILYNPMNIIFDYRVRDIAEYIKNSFFIKNKNIFTELNIYLRENNLSITEIKLLISRVLYPSFYFEMYEDILIDNKEEKILLNIISKLDDYENYLADVINYFYNIYNIEEVDWLKKRRY